MTDQFTTCKTKKARTAFIRDKLSNDQAWALRGLLAIYANQTADEQAMAQTTYANSIGFTGADAEFLTSLAKQAEARGTLSPKQMIYVLKKMPKYSGQLERGIR
jgi:hypothetical protein